MARAPVSPMAARGIKPIFNRRSSHSRGNRSIGKLMFFFVLFLVSGRVRVCILYSYVILCSLPMYFIFLCFFLQIKMANHGGCTNCSNCCGEYDHQGRQAVPTFGVEDYGPDSQVHQPPHLGSSLTEALISLEVFWDGYAIDSWFSLIQLIGTQVMTFRSFLFSCLFDRCQGNPQ